MHSSGRWTIALAVLAISTATLLLLPPGDTRAQSEAIELDVPRVVLRGVPFTVTLKDPTGVLPEGTPLTLNATNAPTRSLRPEPKRRSRR